jgi:hypothetical protein
VTFLFLTFIENKGKVIYRILDIFFVVFHSAIILFNLSGWIWKRTRKWNLAVLGLTGFSWLVIGLIVGSLGYCPLTDWHFSVLAKLGNSELPGSYVKYLADRLTGLSFDAHMVDMVTLYSFLAALLVSLLLNIKDYLKSRSR